MRLLPVGHDHGGGCAPQDESQAERRRHRLRHHQHLPLRHLPAGARSNPRRRQGRVREPTMTAMPRFTRRSFLISSAAVGGGLALGLRLPPFGPAVVRAADGSPEITVWVAIRPDNTTRIRAVRADMGQGTITGLAHGKVEGKALKRLDTAGKVNGTMMYGIDVKLPGMLNAAVKDCPVFGGKVKSFDAARVAGMTGVKKVVQVGDSGVAVIADTWWQAKTALEQLPIVWDEGENAKVSSATIAEVLKAGLDAEQAFVRNQAGGDVKAALAGAAEKIQATA